MYFDKTVKIVSTLQCPKCVHTFIVVINKQIKTILLGFELTPTYVNPTGRRVNCTNRLPNLSEWANG